MTYGPNWGQEILPIIPNHTPAEEYNPVYACFEECRRQWGVMAEDYILTQCVERCTTQIRNDNLDACQDACGRSCSERGGEIWDVDQCTEECCDAC